MMTFETTKSGVNDLTFQTYLLIGFLGFQAISSFFIDDSHVEKGGCVGFFVDSHFQIVECLVVVFLELVVEHAQVEIRLEVFRVHGQRFLIQLVDLVEKRWGRAGLEGALDALGKTVEAVDVLRVQFQNLQVQLFLKARKNR